MAKNSTKRPDKIIARDRTKKAASTRARPGGGTGGKSIKGTMQSPPVAGRVYGSDYERYETKQGYMAYRKKTKKKKQKGPTRLVKPKGKRDTGPR